MQTVYVHANVYIFWRKGVVKFVKLVSFISLNEGPLKVMKNAFYFNLKPLSALKIFTFLSQFFGRVGKRLDKKAYVNLKISDVTD